MEFFLEKFEPKASGKTKLKFRVCLFILLSWIPKKGASKLSVPFMCGYASYAQKQERNPSPLRLEDLKNIPHMNIEHKG